MQSLENNELEFPLENLFVGQIKEVSGIVKTSNEEIDLEIFGEIALYGDIKDGVFELQSPRRILVLGKPLADEYYQYGIFSQGGPAPLSDWDYNGENQIHYQMNLHHGGLTQEDNPFQPRLEKMTGQLTWESLYVDEEIIQLQGVSFFSEALDGSQNIESIEFGGSETTVSLLQAAPPDTLLQLPCSPPTECDPILKTDHLRFVNIQFVNLTGQDIMADVVIHAQMLCEIWFQKAALSINWTIDDNPSASLLAFNTIKNANVNAFLNLYLQIFSLGLIKIYIVPELDINQSGIQISNGITYNSGTFLAVSIISLPHLINDTLICAHEMSHVINLDHANPVLGKPPGTVGSIADVPYSLVNTEHNRRVFGDEDPQISPYFTSNIIHPYCPDP